MNSSPFQKGLEWVYNKFKKNTATTLVLAGTIGWGLSSLAQIGAVMINPKISKEQKSFLVPQEFLDAVVNIGSFFMVTQATKKIISKMASTGKIAPTKVREFLNKNKVYGDQVGKLSLDLDEVLKNESKFPKDSYYSYKNFATTVGTVGASVLSSNIITPVIRNTMASDIQRKYLNNRPQSSNGMKI